MGDKMVEERISQASFDSLPEYSCSVPTGVRIGKVWKCDLNYHVTDHDWVIREYVQREGDVGIETRRPIITEASPCLTPHRN